MSEAMRWKAAWLFVLFTLFAGMLLFAGIPPLGAESPLDDDHRYVRDLRVDGEILSLSALLTRNELADARILEAELEWDDGRLVYELELLDEDGRVRELLFDARSGELIGH
jgi:Predicted membrane protein